MSTRPHPSNHGPAPLQSVARDDRDVFRLAPDVDAAVLDTLAARLEFRGTDVGYVRISQAYFPHLPLFGARRILALGCGTGIEARALARLTEAGTAIVGVDHSPGLIAAAGGLTADEGLSDHVTYEVGDAHRTAFDDESFDIVTLHTLISHVDDPLMVLREARRVVRPGGTIAVFDGDYASLTFAYPDHTMAATIEAALKRVMVANPRIMRDLPRLMAEAGLESVDARGALYADIGNGSFWVAAAESYGALLERSGLVPTTDVGEWRAFQTRSSRDGTFFAASNYYTYLMRRPGPPSSAATEDR